MDPTSFASVLAGIKRMREEYEEEAPTERAAEDAGVQKEAISSEPSGMSSTNAAITVPNAEETEAKAAPAPKPATATRSDSDRAIQHRIRQANVQMYSQIQVSNNQKGNPLLSKSLMKSVPWVFNSSILSDYYINPTIQILFLSLQYHKLHPEYIWTRLKKLNKGGVDVKDRVLRILLVVVDVDAHQEHLRKLSDLCVKQDLSLVLAWSFEEAGNYIVFTKQHELSANKVSLPIRGIKKEDYNSNIVNTLTTVRAINKTDVVNLLANYGSFSNIVRHADDINIQGFGDRKTRNLKAAFHEPFVLNKEYHE